MALMTCGGSDVLRAELHFPARAAWWARLKLDAATAPSGKVTIAAAGGLSVKGTVLDGGVFCDVAHIQVAGGAGGLGAIVPPAAYQQAQLRDPLGAVLQAAGESLSSTTSSSVLAVQLPSWTVLAERAATAIDALCSAASRALGMSITWRILGDGTVWLGAESWPAQKMPAGADLLDVSPDEGRYVIGTDTPSLLPGVALDGVGKVSAVDHWVNHSEVRTWAWV
jgi:hypothetical protein